MSFTNYREFRFFFIFCIGRDNSRRRFKNRWRNVYQWWRLRQWSVRDRSGNFHISRKYWFYFASDWFKGARHWHCCPTRGDCIDWRARKSSKYQTTVSLYKMILKLDELLAVVMKVCKTVMDYEILLL